MDAGVNFKALIEQAKKGEVEEREKAEQQKAEEKQKVEEKQREEEKKRGAKALADQVVVEAEEAQRPPISKVVVPRSIGGVLLLEWTAHQSASEAAHAWEKFPKASGSGFIMNIHSIRFRVGHPERLFPGHPLGPGVHLGIEGEIKVMCPVLGHKQRCEPIRAVEFSLPLRGFRRSWMTWGEL